MRIHIRKLKYPRVYHLLHSGEHVLHMVYVGMVAAGAGYAYAAQGLIVVMVASLFVEE